MGEIIEVLYPDDITTNKLVSPNTKGVVVTLFSEIVRALPLANEFDDETT